MTAAATQTPAKTEGLRFQGGNVGVLLLHGLCGTPAEMRFVAMGLSRAGYTVHVPQLAGHGAENSGSWQDWYVSAREALAGIRKECDTVIVGGLCMGAILGLHLAARNPGKVQGVSLFSPTLWMNGWAMPWTARLFKLVRSRWFAGFMTFPDAASLGIKCPRVRQFVQQALSGEGSEYGRAGVPATMVLEHRRMVDAAMKLLHRVKQPTLIVHSQEDDYAAINNAEYLKDELAGKVDLVVLNDSYHMVTLDKQRQVVVDSTRAFVARIVEEVRQMATPAMAVAA
jgi:carboxylesterase